MNVKKIIKGVVGLVAVGSIAYLAYKSTSYTSKGKKTIVRPEIVENPYNGKMYYQWKTERGK